MSRPLTESDLIFPTQSLSIASTLSSLKRSALSTHNRLSSIQFDADFVASVSEAFGLPLVANERCGSWYISPEKKVESVYFKSTDGHTNEWKFSIRRLNLQVLDLIGKDGGCVIVDSTRRGKSMPDALSKTIPIWCCVMNSVLFADRGEHQLYTPPQAVSESEHVQIEKRLAGFVRDFIDICKPDVELLRSQVQKPLRPIWITQNSSIPDTRPSYPEFHPIVLCTASRRVNGAEVSEGGYIQGAADDHEAWSQGLTPTLFWSHRDLLLNTNEEDLPDLIRRMTDEETASDAVPMLIKPTKNLFISTTQNLNTSPFDVVISCGPGAIRKKEPQNSGSSTRFLHLQCQTGKLGSRDLRTQLKGLTILESWLPLETAEKKILICDSTGKDLAVGTTLAILCMYADSKGMLTFRPHHEAKIDKKLIKQRLAWLTTTHPTLNPPRATLQSVNAFLMPNPSAMQTARSPLTPITPPWSSLRPQDEALKNEPPSSDQGPNSKTTFSSLSSISNLPTPSNVFAFLANNSQPWTFTRTLSSALPSHPSGTVTGTATFLPLTSPSSSSSSSSSSSCPMLLYTEKGEFVTETGLRFTARRKYVYALRDAGSEGEGDGDEESYLAVYFHEEGKEDGVGSLFVGMGDMEIERESVVRVANKEQHLCGEDLYTARWEFPVSKGEEEEPEGEQKTWWKVQYDVKGPKKDYVSDTKYTVATSKGVKA